ncbi:TPA: spore coat protein CotH, partial [Klebsiella pneumoniae]|nr:spore coat protein CotH [Klebsiella pneumoniae]MDF6748778.1 spore coat protein CotH [Escherichia coli]
WQLENLGVKGIDRISSSSKELVLNSAEMIKKQQLQMRNFSQIKQSMIQSEQKVKIGIRLG